MSLFRHMMVKISIKAVVYYILITLNCPKSVSNITMRRLSRQVLDLNSKYLYRDFTHPDLVPTRDQETVSLLDLSAYSMIISV